MSFAINMQQSERMDHTTANPESHAPTRNGRFPSIPRLHFRLTRPTSEWLLILIFIIYVVLSIIIYVHYVEPWINGETQIRIGADSDRYWDAVKLARHDNGTDLVTLEGNLLGPVLIGLLFQNGVGVLCFNIGIFVLAMKIAGSIPGINKTIFGSLILLNAELLPSLTTLNKEILALFAAVLTAKWIASAHRSLSLLAFTLVVSFIARWEQAAILLLFLLFRYSPLHKWPKLSLAILVAAISILYPLAFTLLHVDPKLFDYLLQDANTILRLNSIQAAGGFFVVLVPKVFMTMAGRLAQPWVYWSGDFLKTGFQDPQQEIFQPLGCLCFLVVFAYALIKKSLKLSRPLTILIALTMIITAVPPFIQPRYLFAAYIFICFEIARSPQSGGSPQAPA